MLHHRPAGLLIALLVLAVALPTTAASLRLGANAPQQYDFVDIPRLPEDFGRAEFAMELWLRPDASYPVGPTWRASRQQMENWADADPKPESSPGWWHAGNFLLDGHTRPRGFDAGATREGSFSLQFYGGGRLRWLFSDGDLDVPGKVWAAQAWPATEAPSLLDGAWHHVVAQRRWREPDGARLELWVDGVQLAARDIPQRVDMRQWWDALAHPDDPAALGGWALGSEVMTAWDFVFNQYEDYKGQVDNLRLWARSLSAEEVSAAARGELAGSAGLVADFGFDEGAGERIADRLDPSLALRLHRGSNRSWSTDEAPTAGAPTREHLAPPGAEALYHQWHYTPVVKVDDDVIVSGIPASRGDTYEDKVRHMFDALKRHLDTAGATMADVVEITTFHALPTDDASFREEFARFAPIHHAYFPDRYPAWTAVGTSALLAPGAVVELRARAVVGSGSRAAVHIPQPGKRR